MSRSFCRGEGRPSGLSPVVELQLRREQSRCLVQWIAQMETAYFLGSDFALSPFVDFEQVNLLGGKVRI